MTLEELKAAMETAKQALDADSENEELKKAHEDAKAAYEAKLKESENDGGDGIDDSKFDDKTKAYIAKLRKENATHRTKNKELNSKSKEKDEKIKAILKAAGIVEDEKPEEKLKALASQNNQLEFRAAILESAVEHGVAKDQLDFFEFMVQKAVAALPEDEELSAEQMAEIVKKCKGQSKRANSSINGNGGKDGNTDPAPESKDGEVSFEKFLGMTMMQKSELYQKNPTRYEELAKQARKQKRLV